MLGLDRTALYLLRLVYRLVSYVGWRGVSLPTDVTVKDITIPLEGRTLSAKVFEPASTTTTSTTSSSEGASEKPVLLFFHGGGLCQGGIATTHYNCLLVYASRLQCTVVAVDYRLAPENDFPAGANDCIDTTKWLYQQVQNKESSPFACNGKVIIGGDSAGGLLSIVTGCAVPDLSGAILFYPNTHYDTGEYQSWKDMATGHVIRADMMNMFFRNALGMDAKEFAELHKGNLDLLAKAFPLLTPDSAIQANMPPTFLVTCGFDILKDEGAAFQTKLDKLGVKNEHHSYAEEEHGFMCTEGVGASFDECMSKLKTWFDSQ